MILRLLRIARTFRDAGVPIVPSIIGRLVRLVYGCEISYLADIDRSTRLPHKGLGVVVGDGVVIGPGCTLLQNVTIGGRGGPGVPVLGEGVAVGAGACILGDVFIGAGASVGANAVVLSDVAPGDVVGGVPARVIRRSV